MSAISGIISRNRISDENISKLDQGIRQYHFDQKKFIRKEHVFFECGLQCFTVESLKEQLPYEETEYMLTADILLDNREILMKEMDIKDKSITDSQLVLKAYMKWKYACVEHLLGDYAFAIWDKQKEELFCARDHVGKRSFYYFKQNSEFIFSTVMNPILQIIGSNKVPNEKWLTDYLALPGVIQEIEVGETPFRDIYQLPPAHYLIFSWKGMQIKQYWYPGRVKKFKRYCDQEYENQFNEVFHEAVKCRLRTAGKIGLMMSSGLDSTSVAAEAVPELIKEGKKLDTFTDIPMESFINHLPASAIVNEKPFVLQMQQMYPSIITHFNSFEAKNAWVEINKNIDILEMPYKMIENFYWVEALLEEAHKEKCYILLDGQFGNFTISQGNPLTYWNSLFKELRWVRLAKEIKAFSRFYHVGRKRIYQSLAKKLPYSLRASIVQNINPEKLNGEMIVNDELVNKCKSLRRIAKKGYLLPEGKILDEKEQKQFVTNLVLFSHMGNIETKCSLETGVLRRDPTRDKRVIEFCLSVPMEQYVHNGSERDLIRRIMKEKVPDSIRLNYQSRGKQAADWVQRLIPYWEEIKQEIYSYLMKPSIQYYINQEKVNKLIDEIDGHLEDDLYGLKLRSILIILIFSRFYIKYFES